MKLYTRAYVSLLCLFLALSMSSCVMPGIGTGDFQAKTISNGKTVGINQTSQAAFNGKLYFTLNRNLYVLNAQHNITQLTQGMEVRDPAVSPDGKWIAFIERYKEYSDLMLMSTSGGNARVLRSGNGIFIRRPDPLPPKNTFQWYAQPEWQPDSQHLLFLNDYAKTYVNPGVDDFFIDMQLFSISIDNPMAQPQDVAYATYGDGGLRDPGYRPGHPDQIIYTNYKYDTTQTKQLVQLYFEDANAITNNPGKYRPGAAAIEYDPALALTPATPDLANMQPAFAPDGNSIAYIRQLDANHKGLFVMPVPADATDLLKNPNDPTAEQKALAGYQKSSLILSGALTSDPVWSPDGKQIAYISFTNNTFDIWLATMNQNAKTGTYSIKGNPVQLTTTDATAQLDADSRPFWTRE